MPGLCGTIRGKTAPFMTRTQRLLQLLELLRRRRRPISGAALAQAMGISLRTLYRDIATLQEQGATIEGEAGLGYMLRPGYTLPPLMLTAEEVEALLLGARWVADRADSQLAEAARAVVAKVGSVLPVELRPVLETSALLVGPRAAVVADDAVLAALRLALRSEHKLLLAYVDAQGQTTERTVWPCALGFFDQVSVLVAWCEARQAFRHFRTDRIQSLRPLDTRPPRRRLDLLQAWRQSEGITRADL
jgi:predicted DNA-binding transcriptional regulator YafY